MTPKMYTHFIVIMSVLILSSQGLWSATLTVTSLLDNNAVGTLRTTISDAVSGDTIEFAVAGTINLNPVNGELPVNKKLTIDGGNQISIDGGNAIPVCFHITGSDASDSVLVSIAIHNFRNNESEGAAYGILIDNGANGCSVDSCVIENIHSEKGENALAVGIYAPMSTVFTGSLTNNIIKNITSEDNLDGESGGVAGILIEQDIGQVGSPAHCSRNKISFIASGQAKSPGGPVLGIVTANLNGNCSNNMLSDVFSGAIEGNGISGQVNGLLIVNLTGNCINNTIQNMASGQAINGRSNVVVGIVIGNVQFSIVRNNTIQNLQSGNASGSSGDILGINIFGNANVTIVYNTIDTLISGNSNQDSGTSRGIDLNNHFTGNCSNNAITHLISGNGIATSGTLRGIQFEDGLTGNCSNNIITNLQTGSANSRGFVTGIEIKDTRGSATDSQFVVCNQIMSVHGGQNEEGKNSGIWLQAGAHYTIKANTIEGIHAHQATGSAHGILLGGNGEAAQDNCIELNIISNITAENMQSFGITIEDPNSIGNDILSNSIFAIEKKSINIIDNGVLTDAKVTVTSVRCADGCKLIISGQVIPFIVSSFFTVQFFISDSNTPEQAKTLIGELIHDANQGTPFKVTFSQLPLIQAGQFITATATALVDPNNNTSEVSNAIPTCEPFSDFCPCPAPKPTPSPLCPTVNCNDFIL